MSNLMVSFEVSEIDAAPCFMCDLPESIYKMTFANGHNIYELHCPVCEEITIEHLQMIAKNNTMNLPIAPMIPRIGESNG